MSQTLMACGHAANSTDAQGNPACVICATKQSAYFVVKTPDLSGRTARCDCGRTQPSSLGLPFFEFRGEGSHHATESCGVCRYYRVAHLPERRNNRVCEQFVEAGAAETDHYYCGHSGWD